MIKCQIFRGQKFTDENGKTKFMNQGKVEQPTIDYFDEVGFEKNIKKNAGLQGLKIDAFDKDGNIYWSNYQDVSILEKVEPKVDNELEILKKKYFELSGEEAKGNWGVKKLTELITNFKQ
jgi:hypothetical protein